MDLKICKDLMSVVIDIVYSVVMVTNPGCGEKLDQQHHRHAAATVVIFSIEPRRIYRGVKHYH